MKRLISLGVCLLLSLSHHVQAKVESVMFCNHTGDAYLSDAGGHPLGNHHHTIGKGECQIIPMGRDQVLAHVSVVKKPGTKVTTSPVKWLGTTLDLSSIDAARVDIAAHGSVDAPSAEVSDIQFEQVIS